MSISKSLADTMGLDSDKLDSMSHFELQQLREKYTGDMEKQKFLAPFEHTAYEKELVSENPVQAIPQVFIVPAYQTLKGAGIDLSVDKSNPQTPASLDELVAGYKGIGLGLMDAMGFKQKEKNVAATSETK